MRLIFALLLMSACSPLYAAPKMMERAAWLTTFRQELKTEFCDPKGFVRQCTNAAVDRCNSAVNAASQKCAAQAKLPKKVDPLLDGVAYGRNIGRCVGAKIAGQFKLNNKKECRDVARW